MKSLGSRALGFRVLRFSSFGFRVLGFRVLRFSSSGFRILGFNVLGFSILGCRIVRVSSFLGFRTLNLHLNQYDVLYEPPIEVSSHEFIRVQTYLFPEKSATALRTPDVKAPCRYYYVWGLGPNVGIIYTVRAPG